MEYKPGSMLGPGHASSHFFFPMALQCGTIIIPQNRETEA